MIVREILGQYRIEVETCGTVKFDVQPTNGRHRHDFVEICLVLSGTGRYIHGDGEYMLRPGDVFTADPGVMHEISSHATRDLELWFLTIGVQRLNVLPSAGEDEIVARYMERHRTHAPGQQSLERYLPLIDERAEGLERSAAQMAARFIALGMLQALTGPVESQASKPERHDPVDLALEYMEAKYDRSLGVEEIAAAVGLSPRALRRRFAARLGVGIAEEANQRRMRRAAHLLLMGFSAAEASRMVGIDAPAQFTRCFRRAFGAAPKAFQESYVPGSPGRKTRA